MTCPLFLTAVTLEIIATILLIHGWVLMHRKMVQERTMNEPIVISLHREAYTT